MAIVTQKIGPISAYAIAKEEGYTGTKEQFATEIGNASVNAQAAAASATEAEGYATSAATSASNAMSTTPAGYNSMMESIAPEYDPDNGVYAVGDYCRFNAEIYKCGTAVASPEAFDINKWTKTTVGAEFVNVAAEFAANGIATEAIELTKTGKYYNTSGDTIDPATTSSSTNFACDAVDCAEGDVFTITGTGTSENALPWAIIDSSNNVLARASGTSSKLEVVIAPASAAKLILNNRVASTPDAVSYYGYNVKNMPTTIKNTYQYRGAIPNGTDLNTLTETGWYICGAANTYTNSPENDTTTGQRLIVIHAATNGTPGSGTYRIMSYINNETGYSAYRFYFSGEWHGWSVGFRKNDTVESGTDLNDLYNVGWYILGAASTYPHSPEGDDTTGQRMLIILPNSNKQASSTTYRVMMYFNHYTGISAYRFYFSGEWHRWINFGTAPLSTLSGTVDLDDLYELGWRYIGYSATVSNSPESITANGQRFVFVYPAYNNGSTDTIRIMQYYNLKSGVYAVRLFVTGKWDAWTILSHADANTPLASITPTALASQGENTGDNLRVVSYNVARYNNNTSTYLSDEKLFNFRRAIGKFNADIMCVQEDMQYIDSGNTKESLPYLYLPQYPYSYNGNVWKNTIHSKKPAAANGRVKLTAQGNDYRSIEFATYTIGAKTLLICSSHPSWNDSGEGGDSATQIAIRLSNYTEIFQWVTGQITLPDLTTTNPVSAPTHTHCIICMDANSATATDKTNLETLAANNNFILGNGGALGWYYTCHGSSLGLAALDNVIVSDNIIINNIESYMELWRNLYSDHVPVVADVTLL